MANIPMTRFGDGLDSQEHLVQRWSIRGSQGPVGFYCGCRFEWLPQKHTQICPFPTNILGSPGRAALKGSNKFVFSRDVEESTVYQLIWCSDFYKFV